MTDSLWRWKTQVLLSQQVLKVNFNNKTTRTMYLNDGTGNPWAWHRTAKLLPFSWSKDEIFDVVENVGALDPTGSKHKPYIQRVSIKMNRVPPALIKWMKEFGYTNLNDGTGNPWAGHNNGKLNFSRALNPRILSKVAIAENLGEALPTGSNRTKNKKNSQIERSRADIPDEVNPNVRKGKPPYLNEGTGNPCAGHKRV